MKRNTVLIATMLLVSGCSTTSIPVPQLGGERVAQPVQVSTLGTGLVGRAGVALSPGDAASALRAEQYALASAPSGEEVSWQGSKSKGTVVAASPYKVGDQNCRQYTQRVYVGGSEYTGRGAACRDASGNWSLLN